MRFQIEFFNENFLPGSRWEFLAEKSVEFAKQLYWPSNCVLKTSNPGDKRVTIVANFSPLESDGYRRTSLRMLE